MKPTRHLRLILWYLLYQIHPQVELSREWELRACEHCKMSSEALDRSKDEFPQLWKRMYSKRQRRLEYLLQHRFVPDGWTPPDPHDWRSRNRPFGAWAKRPPAHTIGEHDQQ